MQPETHLTSSFFVPSYFVYLSLVYCGLILLTPWMARRQKRNALVAMNISLILMIVGFVGARLFYAVYEQASFYRRFPENIFYFWSGGFVFFGGAIPAALAVWYYLSLQKEPIGEWFDFFSPIVALGYGLGRFSCLLAGCCFGRVCDLPWAFRGRHPTQVYAMIWELSVAALLILARPWLQKKLKPGGIFFFWVFLHSLGRLLMENYRDDFRGPAPLGISISSWIGLVLLAASISGLFRLYLRRSKS